MKKTELVAIFVRLVAVTLIFLAIIMLAGFIPFQLYGGGYVDWASIVLVFLYYLFFLVGPAVILWNYPTFIAKNIIPVGDNISPKSKWCEADLLGVGISLVALFFFCDGLVNVASQLIVYTLYFDELHTKNYLTQIIPNFFKIFLALILMCKNISIQKLLYKLRYGGTK